MYCEEKNNTRPLGKRVCRLSVYYVHVKSKNYNLVQKSPTPTKTNHRHT